MELFRYVDETEFNALLEGKGFQFKFPEWGEEGEEGFFRDFEEKHWRRLVNGWLEHFSDRYSDVKRKPGSPEDLFLKKHFSVAEIEKLDSVNMTFHEYLIDDLINHLPVGITSMRCCCFTTQKLKQCKDIGEGKKIARFEIDLSNTLIEQNGFCLHWRDVKYIDRTPEARIDEFLREYKSNGSKLTTALALINLKFKNERETRLFLLPEYPDFGFGGVRGKIKNGLASYFPVTEKSKEAFINELSHQLYTYAKDFVREAENKPEYFPLNISGVFIGQDQSFTMQKKYRKMARNAFPDSITVE